MYSPDKWIILKIKGKNETLFKVLAGWSGSYLEGQRWRMNSGISKISEDGDYYLIEGFSGSVYKCHKQSYGTNMISSGVLSGILEDPKTKDKVEVLPDQNFFKLFQKSKEQLVDISKELEAGASKKQSKKNKAKK